MNPVHEEHARTSSFWGTRYSYGWIVIAAVAGYFLLTEHLAHVIEALPAVLLLACFGMHFFMHRGHGGPEHAGDGSKSQSSSDRVDENKRGDVS